MKLWESIKEIFQKRKERIEDLEVKDLEKIPTIDETDLETGKWFKVRNVVAIYVDMEGSTQLSNESYIKTSAKIYELFTGALSDIFKIFGAPYVDIKGDGGFALFKERFGSVKALLSEVTFRTYVKKYLTRYVKSEIKDWTISSNSGMAMGTVLVKRIGNRGTGGNPQNWMVWVGKPVNIAAKLSEIAPSNSLLIQDEMLENFRNPKELEKYLILSCGCIGGKPTEEKTNLWKPFEVPISHIQDLKISKLESLWCDIHGEDYLNSVLKIIGEEELGKDLKKFFNP